MSRLAELLENYDAIVFFDTETTGLEPTAASRIIELAALRIEKDEDGKLRIAGKMDDLIRLAPGEHIPAKIVELTGITDDMLAQYGVTEATAAASFKKLIAGRVLLVAHNAQFDLLFTREMMKRQQAAGASLVENCDAVDSLTVYKDRAPYPHKLENAIEHYGLQNKVKNSHRAIDDVLALYCVFYAMAEERMDLTEYVNIFGYNIKYGAMEPRLDRITYSAQDFHDGLVDPAATLPSIVREINMVGEQLTLGDMMQEAATWRGGTGSASTTGRAKAKRNSSTGAVGLPSRRSAWRRTDKEGECDKGIQPDHPDHGGHRRAQ